MLLQATDMPRIFHKIAECWKENVELLSEIDSKYGDGDHGVTIKKIANCISKPASEWENKSLKENIEQLSFGIMNIGGGSAGPLYGTLVEGLAEPLAEDTAAIDSAMMGQMIDSSRSLLFEVTKARLGDKTMIDAVIPAAAAAQEETGDLLELLEKTAQAAKDGAEATKDMVSKYGRARSYGEQTLGTRDAGAVSTALFFEGLYLGAKEIQAERK